MTKLFVGGISYSISNQQLEQLFAQYGTVVSAQIIMDKFTGQSKGFAFVEMADDSQAQTAIKELDGTEQDGRKIGVSVARPKEENNNNGGFRKDFKRNDRNGGNNKFSKGYRR